MSTVFNKDEQKKIKVINKIIYIVAKVIKILIRVAIVALILSSVILAVVLNNLKITDTEIQLFNDKVCTYEINNNEITISDGENTETFSINGYEKIDLKEIIDNYSSGLYTVYIESIIIFAIVILIIVSLILKYVEKLFRNIYNDETPFTLDNVEYIKKIALFYIILFVSKIIIGIIIRCITKIDTVIVFNFLDCIFALIIISLLYVFKYGCEIQKDSKAKMYGDEEE